MKFYDGRTVGKKWAAGFLGTVCVLGFLVLSLTFHLQPLGDSCCAAAEPAADGPIASPEPDWPQWNGPRRDSISGEKGLLPRWPERGPRLVWKIGNLGVGWSSPIIVRDRLYVSGEIDKDLVISAFDLDGKPVWQTKNGRSWTGSYPGARACCAYSEGKLYHMNAHGRVACFEAAKGKELWAVDVLEQFQGQNITWGMSECLLVDGPRVIVTPGGEKALMAALDKTHRPHSLGHGAAPRRPGIVLLAAALASRRRAHPGQLLLGARLRRGCRQREAPLDGAAAEAPSASM